MGGEVIREVAGTILTVRILFLQNSKEGRILTCQESDQHAPRSLEYGTCDLVYRSSAADTSSTTSRRSKGGKCHV